MTSIQPIIKSNAESFMLNNLFYMINIKKITAKGGWWEVGDRSKFPLGSGNSIIY